MDSIRYGGAMNSAGISLENVSALRCILRHSEFISAIIDLHDIVILSAIIMLANYCSKLERLCLLYVGRGEQSLPP